VHLVTRMHDKSELRGRLMRPAGRVGGRCCVISAGGASAAAWYSCNVPDAEQAWWLCMGQSSVHERLMSDAMKGCRCKPCSRGYR
jgi:hypothetical protein